MSKQKAVHIIKYEREWKEVWTGQNGPAEVTRKNIYFLCGTKWETVRFPEDHEMESVKENKQLPHCRKCLKKREVK